MGLPVLSARADRFVLPPEAGDAVRDAFVRTAPDWTLASATLSEAGIRAKACRPDGTCSELRLTHPDTCAADTRLGPFCVAAVPPLDDAARARLATAFAPVDAALWKRVAAPPPPSDLTPSSKPGAPPETSRDAWLLYGCALLLGLVIGRLVRSAPARRSLFLLLFVALAAACTRLPLPPADALLAFLVTATVSGLVSSKRPRLAIPLTLSSLALALGGMEFAVRVALPEPLDPGPPPPFWLDQSAEEDLRCLVLSGTVDPTRRDREPPADLPTVLHLGDSMLLANGLPDGQRATDLLERDTPGVVHRNAGIAGTGPDLDVLLAPRWLARYSPRAVVVHLFAGNDLDDVATPLRCCPGGPLLVEAPDGTLTPRCDLGHWRFSAIGALDGLRAPYPLLALTGSSRLARHAARATRVAGLTLARQLPVTRVDPATHLARVLVTLDGVLRAPGRKVAYVVLPERRALRAALDTGVLTPPPPHVAIMGAARATGSDVVDAWPFLLDALRTHGDALFMQTIPDDPHFSTLGHALYAPFLAALPALAP